MENLFDYKKTYITKNGEELVNLSIPVHNIKNITYNGVLKTTQDEQGRIDKFAYRNVGKDLNTIDILMYANHIYNPFAVKLDEMLFLPVDSDIYTESLEPTLPDGSSMSSNNSATKKRTYAEEVEYLARMGLGIK